MPEKTNDPAQPDISSVSKKKAFLGEITHRIRNAAWHICKDRTGYILDVGCGNGLFFTSLRRNKGKIFVGADLSLELLKEARAVFRDNNISGVHLAQGDAFRLPFKKESLDVVLCLNTLYNLESWEKVIELLDGMMEVCKPNGRIIFDIRNRANPFMRLKYWWHRRKRTFFTYAYRMDQVTNFLESRSFAVETKVSVGFKLLPFAYVIEAEKISSKK